MTLEGVRRLCEQWGGKLVCVSEEEFDSHKDNALFCEAPFTHADLGVLWMEKTILYTERVPACPYEVIHEMGHVFACDFPPDDAEEFNFFGWEYTTMQHLGLSHEGWVKANRHYMVSGSTALSNLTESQLSELIAERIRVAEFLQLVRSGVPLTIR